MSNPVAFETGGRAAVLSYNVPEPTSYHGQRVVELDLSPLGSNVLISEGQSGSGFEPPPPSRLNLEEVKNAMMGLFNDPQFFPVFPPNTFYFCPAERGVFPSFYEGTTSFEGILRISPNTDQMAKFYATEAVSSLTPAKVLAELKAGRHLVVDWNYDLNQYDGRFVPFQTTPPRLVLLEKYRLTSLLGKYGAGRTLKTFSLLPGEKTRISIKTYQRSSVQSRTASSILDSHTDESARDFEQALSSEETDKQNQARSHEWHVEAEAENNWGFVKVQASAAYRGGISSAREQFSRNMSNAVQKHSAKASSKRDIAIQDSTEISVESGEEQGVERELQNVNVGRTLNFVFRQMNQEFYSFLTLVDVHLGFSSGVPGDLRIYTLADLDRLLGRHVREAYRARVKELVLNTLSLIFDHAQVPQVFWEERQVAPAAGGEPATTYYRIKTEMVSQYQDPATETSFQLPGIIVGVSKNVLRTDGVIAEAVLGQGVALDEYSEQLQMEAVRGKQLENDLQALRHRRDAQAFKILQDVSGDGSKVYTLLYPPAPQPAAGV
jgi:hypothetical protein